MKKRIKMFAFDLDGTLLTEDKKITPETKAALKRAADNGVYLVPTTGRPISGLPEELTKSKDILYIISANGSRIIDNRDNSIIKEDLIGVELSAKVLKVLSRYDCIIDIYYDGIGYMQTSDHERVYMFHTNPAIVDYYRSTRRVVPDIMEKFHVENRPVDKLQGTFISMEERSKARAELSAMPEIKVTSALSNNLEINLSDVNKGTAMCFLGEKLGVNPDEIMAAGDGDNDVEMVEMAGIGIAMENAVDELKEAADEITDSNENDGIAKAIEKFIME